VSAPFRLRMRISPTSGRLSATWAIVVRRLSLKEGQAKRTWPPIHPLPIRKASVGDIGSTAQNSV